MDSFVHDSFTAASDTALGSHSPDQGGVWRSWSADGMTVVAADGAVKGDSSSAGSIFYNDAKVVADCIVQANVWRTASTAGAGNPGLVARLQTSGDSRYIFSNTGNGSSLVKRVAGVTTNLSILPATTAPLNVGTVYACELRVIGPLIEVWWSGTKIISLTDTSIANGYVGVTGRSLGRVDDLYAYEIVSASALGSLASVALSPATGAATGGASAFGSMPSMALSNATATASGSAVGAGAFSSLAVQAPTATAKGSALASGAFASLSFSSIVAAATGGANASGAIPTLTIVAPIGEGVAPTSALKLSARTRLMLSASDRTLKLAPCRGPTLDG